MRKKTASSQKPSAFFVVPLVGLIIFAGLIWLISSTSAKKSAAPTPVASATPIQSTDSQPTSVPQTQAAIEVGKPAPDFSLKDVDGKEVRLSDFAGKPVLINFWATWCPPCREEMPEINKFYGKYKGSGLVVLSINATFQDSVENVKSTIKSDKLTFPVLLDEAGQVARQYQLNGLPTSFFIDDQGIIRKIQIGEVEPDRLDVYFSEMTSSQ